MNMFCKNCGNQIPDGAAFCSVCGAAVNDTDNVPSEVLKPAHPMKWHKFLIYFLLFLSAIVNLANGIAYTVALFRGTAGFGAQRVIWIVNGVVSVAAAVLAIYVRFRLAGFRKNGPKLYMIFLGIIFAQRVMNLSYAISTGADSVANAETSLFINGCIMLWTYSYYKKRADMFVN